MKVLDLVLAGFDVWREEEAHTRDGHVYGSGFSDYSGRGSGRGHGWIRGSGGGRGSQTPEGTGTNGGDEGGDGYGLGLGEGHGDGLGSHPRRVFGEKRDVFRWRWPRA